MTGTLSSLIYLLAGMAIVYLFQTRRKKLGEFSNDDIPEMTPEDYKELTVLLKTAYERMLYMGVLFFPLAYTSYADGALISKAFFLVLILLLFVTNIPPRNKIMRLLDRYDLSIEHLKNRGIHL